MSNNTVRRRIKSPLGEIEIVANQRALVKLNLPPLPTQDETERVTVARPHPVLDQAERELEEYFANQRTTFSVEVEPEGTSFQKLVWGALCKIPFGETWSYKKLAIEVGNEKAMRAVGGANRVNPIAIIIPCHRVIGANGNLVGYAGGLPTKQWLLQHEQSVQSAAQQALFE